MDGEHTHTHTFFAIPSFAWPCHSPLILFEYLQIYKVKKIENEDGRGSEWQRGRVRGDERTHEQHIKRSLKRKTMHSRAGVRGSDHTMRV